MKLIIQLTGALGLLLTIIPSLLVFAGSIDLATHRWLMLIGVVLWFGSRGWKNWQGEAS